eukprot:5699995-Alexandrium_andersonii.AAC.1
MLPGGPIDMTTAARVAPALPEGPGTGLSLPRGSPGAPSVLVGHAAYQLDPTFGAALPNENGVAWYQE